MSISILFVVIILILLLAILRGYHLGVVGFIVGIISWIAGFACMVFVSPFTKRVLVEYTFIDEDIHDKIVEYLSQKIPSEQSTGISLFGYLDAYRMEAIENISEQVTDAVMQGLAVVVTFLVVFFLIRIIGFFLMRIQNRTRIGVVSKAIGGIWGCIEGLCISWMIFFVIHCLEFTIRGQKLALDIQNNVLLSLLDQYNVITKIFAQIL